MKHETYIKEILKLAKKAFEKEEVPVGALIVYNNKIIARGYNKTVSKKSVLEHAEIEVIKKAENKLGDWRLSECTLYVSLKPCHMCQEIIKQSRIKNVFYLCDNQKKINYKTNFERLENMFYLELEDLIKEFFKNKRKG